MNRLADLLAYRGVLPYASEIFGVYQPLLGWKSRRKVAQITKGFRFDRLGLFAQAIDRFPSDVAMTVVANQLEIQHLGAAHFTVPGGPRLGSVFLHELARAVPPDAAPQAWDAVTPNFVQKLLNGPVHQAAVTDFPRLLEAHRSNAAISGKNATQIMNDRLRRESSIAGLVLELKAQNAISDLRQLVHGRISNSVTFLGPFGYDNPIDSMDPNKDLDRVGLSPIGIVHLFRQYFFELDTFLGTPVSHVWLSPGSNVELIEISTRRTIVERTQELALQTTIATEQASTSQDDLSDAVKDENQSSMKFGASVTANESWIWGSASETGSFDMGNTQKNARETAHKQMRQQSQKLTEEIKKNFKTTFKTVTEQTDTSSKRYVLGNTTDHLINYELRRKMRQVGVQVQDIGSYLCWETYVDDVGRDLGIAKMVHIGAPPDQWGDPNPDATPMPQPIKGDPIGINFTWPLDDDHELIGVWPIGVYQILPPKPQYVYDRHELHLTSGDAPWPLVFVAKPLDRASMDGEFNVPISLIVEADTQGLWVEAQDDYPQFTLQLTIFYRPSKDLLDATEKANQAKVAAANNEKIRAYKDAFLKESRDRIKAASNVRPRPYEELREEERIVVYRRLIQNLLTHGLKMPDHRTQHVVAELLNSIFDVDKMLYFVAPEWWKPRTHSHQEFGGNLPVLKKDGTPVLGDDGQPLMAPQVTSSLSSEAVVDWGEQKKEDDYYITEDSSPAKIGSSLGWLLQLDGDNLRNAFLNSPWVKAVVPIRPGRERAAINWLKHVEGLDGIGPKDIYSGNEPELKGKSMIEVLEILADKVAQKHQNSLTLQSFPDPATPGDPASTITATPVDAVYEHGFYPLQDSFRVEPGGDFEVFDQWVEILPTDQIVPVEVTYNPKTGRQV